MSLKYEPSSKRCAVKLRVPWFESGTEAGAVALQSRACCCFSAAVRSSRLGASTLKKKGKSMKVSSYLALHGQVRTSLLERLELRHGILREDSFGRLAMTVYRILTVLKK